MYGPYSMDESYERLSFDVWIIHPIQQLLCYWIQKYIFYLNRTILVVDIVVWITKNSYSGSASSTSLKFAS